MRIPLLIAALIATGCGKQRPDPDDSADDSGVIDEDDYDGDGYEQPEDCDDNDPDVNPGQPELCNGEDDDCDGVVDEDPSDATPWYTDADGDTYGTDDSVEYLCDNPGDGRVPDGGDCDDSEPLRSPGATERCDDIDNDCDGETDEDDAIDAPAWYVDEDGDGWGDLDGGTTRACEAPEGYGDQFGDCDDDDAEAYPGAEEVCDDKDNDCDGTIDEPNASGAHTWYADDDGDSFGDASSTTRGCDQPSGYVEDSSDCDDADSGIYPGAAETCDSVDQDCDSTVDEEAGDALTWYVDSDRDGFGEPSTTQAACTRPAGYAATDDDCDDGDSDTYPGAAEICGDGVVNDCDGDSAAALAECSLVGVLPTSVADATLVGATAGEYAGYRVAGLGDMNGDGLDDVLVGAYRAATSGGAQAGVAYVVYGGVTGSITLSSADAILQGSDGSDNAAYSISAAGDVDADGTPDLLVGAPGNDDGGRTAGSAYLVLGPVSGTSDLADADAQITGASSYDSAGRGVAGGMDVNGDSYADFFIGADGDDRGGSGAGAVVLFFGADPPPQGDLDDGDVAFHGAAASAALGEVIGAGGDLDGDGLGDLVIGAFEDDGGGTNAGAVFVFTDLGGYSGDTSVDDADATLEGAAADDQAGSSVAIDGDADGDGYSDLLIGAPTETTGGNNAGAAYLFLGPVAADASVSSADLVLLGSPGGYAGRAVAFGGDLDGDSIDDLLVGADYVTSGSRYSGSAYIVLGNTHSGSLNLSSADGEVQGSNTYDYTGAALDAVGDFSGTGRATIIVGAWGNDTGGSSAGAAFLMSGQDY